MILVFDFETSNLPQPKLPLDHPAQARIVQLGAVVLDDKFNERASFCALIKPEGWVILPGAFSAHGIRQDECEKHGVCIKDALSVLYQFQCVSEMNVAHNIEFEKKLLAIELDIQSMVHSSFGEEYCTMRLMTPVCMLPGGRGGEYKWPKLQEAYEFVTGHKFIGAHNALRDVRATAEIFKYLVDKKHISIPQLILA